MAKGLAVTGDIAAAAAQIKALYKLFDESDCTMVEVNPLAEDEKGRLVAADAKIGFDDNAAFRQKEIFALRDESQMDPRWVGGGIGGFGGFGVGCRLAARGLR